MNPKVHIKTSNKEINPIIISNGSLYDIIRNIIIDITAAGITNIRESVITEPNSFD